MQEAEFRWDAPGGLKRKVRPACPEFGREAEKARMVLRHGRRLRPKSFDTLYQGYRRKGSERLWSIPDRTQGRLQSPLRAFPARNTVNAG
jgi:hypothetical protein